MSEAELHDMVGEQVEDLTQHDLSLRNTEKIEYDEFVNLLKSVRKEKVRFKVVGGGNRADCTNLKTNRQAGVCTHHGSPRPNISPSPPRYGGIRCH